MRDHHFPLLQGWTPVRFFRRDDGQPTVEWCLLGDLRLTAPFFLQTTQTARFRGCPTRQTPADVLTEFADAAPDLPLAGWIFHLSRCGSTLVTQMLGALAGSVVLSEAAPVDEVLRADQWLPPAGEAVRIGWLRGLIHAYGAGRFPDERRLFVKLNPWHILDLAVIRAAFPGVPWIFLYRDPVEILVSQSDNLAAAMVPGPDGPERIGLRPMEVARLTVEEYCARMLGWLAHAAAEAVSHDPSARLVAYPQLPGAVETVIAPWFGLTLDAEDRARLQRVARYHSKAPGRLVFKEDSARKQRDADDDLRALAERWMAADHLRLEQWRTGQYNR